MQNFRIDAQRADVSEVGVDVLVLKYANGYHGADHAVATALGLPELQLKSGEHRLFPTGGKIAAKAVLFVGVGVLHDFDYSQITRFAAAAMDIVRREVPEANWIGITVHGPGYGLDELASIDSLVSGLRSASLFSAATYPRPVRVTVIDRNERRVSKLSDYLAADQNQTSVAARFSPEAARAISSAGTYEKRLFAAMPFGEKYLDHWEFALEPAAHKNKVVIERLDHEHFVGEILTEIRTRIERASAVVAILDDNNPNVFLEVGYAWGIRKPAILALHEQCPAPFDVSGHKLIRYSRLGDLREQLEVSLRGLLDNKVF